MSAADDIDEKEPDQDQVVRQAAEIFQKVVAAIRTHSHGTQKKEVAALKSAIQACLIKEFAILKTDEEKKKLRRKLSLSFHPDKIKSMDPVIVAHLQSLNALELPFQCVDAFKDSASILEEVSNSPIGWAQKVVICCVAIFTARLQVANLDAIRDTLTENHTNFEQQIPLALYFFADKYGVQIEPFGLKVQWYSRVLGQLAPTDDFTLQILGDSVALRGRVGFIPVLCLIRPGGDLRKAMKGLAEALSYKVLGEEDGTQLEQILTALNKTPEEIAAEIESDLVAQVNQAQEEIEKNRKELSALAPGLFFVFFKMGDDLDRYVRPFRWLAKLILYPCMVVLVLTVLASFLSALLFWGILKLVLIKMLREPLGFFINLLTGGWYNERVKAYKEASAAKNFSDEMESAREINPAFLELSDDEIFAELLPELKSEGIETKEAYSEQLKGKISLGLAGFLQCSFDALWDSLTSVPKGLGWGVLWTLTWIPRLALVLVFSLVGGALEAVKAIVPTTLIVSIFLLALVVRYSLMFIVNLPLYLLIDLPRALGREMLRFFYGIEPYPEPDMQKEPLLPSELVKNRATAVPVKSTSRQAPTVSAADEDRVKDKVTPSLSPTQDEVD